MMNMKQKFLSVVISGMLLSACGGKTADTDTAQTQPEGATTTVAAADAAPASFGQCSVCHKVEKDAGNGVGPNLHGIVGAKAGQVAGYTYSTAMKESGVVWDEASLDKYLENPRGFMAGTKMSYGGQSDAAKRKEMIAWLKKNS
jgi:cytochrome c